MNTPTLTDDTIVDDQNAEWRDTFTLAICTASTIESRSWKPEQVNWAALTARLLTHPEASSKSGSAYLPGALIGCERKKTAARELSLLVIDSDSGDDLREITARLRSLGYEAIVHSTFSHLANETRIRYDDFKKYSGGREPAAELVAQYLFERKGMRREVLGNIRIIDVMKHTPDGVFILIEHQPIQKGRIIIPLATPFVIPALMKTLNLSQREVQALWANYLGAAAQMLGITLDRSCTDVSRAFYWPRHAPGKPNYAEHVRGKPIDLDTLVMVNPNTQRSEDKSRAPSRAQLIEFAAKHGKNLQLADLIAAEALDRVRGGTSALDGLVVECPFDELHSNSGDPNDKACFVVNASDAEHGGFVWRCHHASCKDHDRLNFLEKALADGWFEPSVLSKRDYFLDQLRSPCDTASELAGKLTRESNATETNAVLKHLACCEDPVVVEMVLKKIKELVGLGVTAMRKFLDDLRNKARSEAPRSGKKPHFVWLTQQFDWIIKEVSELLTRSNEADPRLFHMTKMPVRIVEDEATHTIVPEPLTKAALRQELNGLATWSRREQRTEKSISCPGDVAEHLINDPELPLPPLTAIVDTPIFDAEGHLVAEPGYHPSIFTYYHSRAGFQVPPVSKCPSNAEVEEAKQLLLTEVLGDFPFSDGSPDGRASKAHALVLMLEPFARQMIGGFTPIYLIQKPTPGTGATLFVNAFAEVAFGTPAIPQAEVHSPDEFRKNLTATLMAGTRLYWLDNVHHKVDDAGLALATTTEVWKDRILGHSKTAVLPVKCSWIISGNNVELSNELARRSVLVRLDANVERPTDRTDFRHPNLIGFVRANRARLVWACLTLIQAWIAAGRPLGDRALASYEPWSRTMGGILTVLGVEGFLENRDELKEIAADDDAPIKVFVKLWYEEFESREVPVSASNDWSSGPQRAQSLLDLYRRRRHEIDLGFNDKREETWPSLLGRCINKYKNRVFEIAVKGTPVRVKLRTGRDSAGAMKWLQRINN